MINATKAIKYTMESIHDFSTIRAIAGVTYAILHLADIQRERNQLAAMTAKRRGMTLPDNLTRLIEGVDSESH